MDKLRTTNILLFTLTVFVLIVALKLAESVIVTILVSFLLAFVMEIPVRFLRHLKVPLVLAVIITAVVFFGLLLGLVYASYRSLRDFALQFPVYQEKMSVLLTDVIAKIETLTAGRLQVDLATELEKLSIPAYILSITQSIASSVIVFVVISIFSTLIVYGKNLFPKKLIKAFPRKKDRRIPVILTQINNQVRKYIGVKTLSSIFVGLAVGTITAFFRVEFVVLWVFLGFLFNYIPVIGPFFSSIMPALIGLVQYGELATPIWIFVVLVAVNMLIHNVIEPLFQGEVLNLSLLVVFFSLLFWGWLWGHLGVFLALPMTSGFKIILENIPITSSFATLLEKPIRRRPLDLKKRSS